MFKGVRWVDVCLLLGISILFHVLGIDIPEFLGEDETEFLKAGLFFFKSAAEGHLNGFVQLVSAPYPPMQYLFSSILCVLYGPAEWSVRLPTALLASFSTLFVYLVGCRSSGRLAGVICGFLSAASGVIGNHKFALTCGLAEVGVVIAGCGLWHFIDSKESKIADKWLVVGSVGITFAIMSLPDGLFFLPVLLAAYVSKRGFSINKAALVAMIIIIGWLVIYGVFWFAVPKYVLGMSGSVNKAADLFSQIGTFRLTDLYRSVRGAVSPALFYCSFILIPLGLLGLRAADKWYISYFGLHVFLWVFVFDYTNVRSAHILISFPLYAFLVARGVARVNDYISKRIDYESSKTFVIRIAGVIALFYLLVGTAAQAAAMYVTDKSPQYLDKVFGPFAYKMSAQGGRMTRGYGLYAAGAYIRKNSLPGDTIVCNLGGASGYYYFFRPVSRWNDWISKVRESNDLVNCRLRWWVRTMDEDDLFYKEFGRSASVAAYVKIGDIRGVEVIDMFERHDSPVLLDDDQARREYRKSQPHWTWYTADR